MDKNGRENLATTQDEAVTTHGKPLTPGKPLRAQQEQAASLVAEGVKHLEVAGRLGIAQNTLSRWKSLPDFQARVSQLRQEATKELAEQTIASVHERIRRRDLHWKRLHRLVDLRAENARNDPDAQEEAKTGFYVPVLTKFKDGGEERTHRFDRDLVRAIGGMEELTGKELGQHVHRTEVSGPGGAPIAIDAHLTLGYRNGTLHDAIQDLRALLAAGRLPTTPEQAEALAREMFRRRDALQRGKSVPPLEQEFPA